MDGYVTVVMVIAQGGVYTYPYCPREIALDIAILMIDHYHGPTCKFRAVRFDPME